MHCSMDFATFHTVSSSFFRSGIHLKIEKRSIYFSISISRFHLLRIDVSCFFLVFFLFGVFLPILVVVVAVIGAAVAVAVICQHKCRKIYIDEKYEKKGRLATWQVTFGALCFKVNGEHGFTAHVFQFLFFFLLLSSFLYFFLYRW